jgi:tetratricopeptide (TPR) repeat protein
MRSVNLFIVFIITLFLFQCGNNDTIQKADTAFTDGQYLQAIRLYKEALQNNPENELLKEKIALSYMYNGKLLYTNTKNINSFANNLERASAFIPANPSQTFNTSHSQVLLALSKAYINTKPENDIEKEKFFFESISTLEQSLILDSTNVEADSLLAEMNKKYFEKLLNRANSFYNKALQEQNVDFYFAAQKYLKMAKKFNSTNPDVITLEIKLRKKLAGVLDYNEGFSFAVLKYLKEKNNFITFVTVKNYLKDSVELDLNNFEIVDTKGNIYNISEKEMGIRQVYDTKCLVNTTLTPEKSYIEGIIVFAAPDSVEMHYISYKKDDTNSVKKYFR